jgi:hypothetical protein
VSAFASTYPFLAGLLQPFHKARRKTLGLVIAAIAATGQARSFAIATTLSTWLTLLAVVLLIWTMAGIVSADVKPSLRLRCRRKGPRQSFVTIGIRAVLERSFSARFDRESVPLILERPTMRPLRVLAASK